MMTMKTIQSEKTISDLNDWIDENKQISSEQLENIYNGVTKGDIK